MPGQAGTTAALIGTAVRMAADGGYPCMMFDCHYQNQRLSDYLYQKEYRGLGEYEGALGMDALFRYGKAGRLAQEQLRSAAISFLQERLFLIAGTRKSSPESFYQELAGASDDILRAGAGFDGHSLFDLEAGDRRETAGMLEGMDLIVVCFPQNPMIIREYFQKYSIPLSKCYFLLGNYDRRSRFNERNLRSHFRGFHSYNLGRLSHCTGYGDALCRQDGLRYLLRNLKKERLQKDADAMFRDLDRIRDQIQRRLDKGGYH